MTKNKLLRKQFKNKASSMEPCGIHDNNLRKLL